jgi:hypothetical protein
MYVLQLIIEILHHGEWMAITHQCLANLSPKENIFSLIGFRGSLQPVEKSEFSLRKKKQWLQALIMAIPLTIG